MRARFPLALGLGLLAAGCAGSEEVPEPITSGTVTEDATGRSAQAETFHAFAYATGGSALLFLSSHPDATCDSIVESLNADVFDPSEAVNTANRCNLIFKFRYEESEGFEGLSFDDSELGPIWNINCAMGEGSWTLQGEGRERDWRFTPDDVGGWWQGGAGTWTASVTQGVDGNTPDVSFELGPDLRGQFIYEDTEPDPATGTITGDITSERCRPLAQTPIFGG